MAYKSAALNSERGSRGKVDEDGAKLGPCDGSEANRGRSFVAFWLLGNLHHDFGVAAHVNAGPNLRSPSKSEPTCQ